MVCLQYYKLYQNLVEIVWIIKFYIYICSSIYYNFFSSNFINNLFLLLVIRLSIKTAEYLGQLYGLLNFVASKCFALLITIDNVNTACACVYLIYVFRFRFRYFILHNIIIMEIYDTIIIAKNNALKFTISYSLQKEITQKIYPTIIIKRNHENL